MSGFIDELSATRNVIGKKAICPTSDEFSLSKEMKRTQAGM